MRFIPLFAVVALAACSGGTEEKVSEESFGLAEGVWSDGERSAFCSQADGDAAFIVYAEDGDANCMAEGRLGEFDGALALVPRGDERCRIPIEQDGQMLRFGEVDEECAYYCGGETTLAGRSLMEDRSTDRAFVDPAGDQIC